MNERDRQRWNAAVERGDADEIGKLKDELLTGIHQRIITDDRYIERTRGQ